MEITLSELLNGNATKIKNKDYFATKDYVQPFIDSMSAITTDFRIKVKLPDQITMAEEDHITYNRVLIEAVLPPTHTIDDHDEVIGFLYGLDVRKPLSKVYRGYLNRACTNLSVFDPKWLIVSEVKPSTGIILDTKKMLELPSTFEATLKKLKGEVIDRLDMTDRLGEWIDISLRENYYNGMQNVKISPTVSIEAYKSLLLDENSNYFVPLTKEITKFDVYNAFTQVITDDTKDIMNRFEKTMMVNTLLKV